LEKGLVSQIEQKRRVDYVLEQTSKLQTLAQQLAAKQGQLLNARAQLEQAPMAAQERVRSLRTDLNSTEQKIAEVSGRSAALVRSPIAGEVALLTASVGQTTDPKRLEAEIVPEGTRLLAEVFVTPQASGLVQSGQQVRIRFDAFPHAYGTFGGVVQQVSHTPLTSEDHLVTPIPIKDTVYRVVIRLDKDVIIEDGKTRKLSPGMLVHADIILERRTIAGWIANMIRGLRWTV
jgi:membrane fusion protein